MFAGDLNSKVSALGETRTDSRGRLVLEMSARLDLTVLNVGNIITPVLNVVVPPHSNVMEREARCDLCFIWPGTE